MAVSSDVIKISNNDDSKQDDIYHASDQQNYRELSK